MQGPPAARAPRLVGIDLGTTNSALAYVDRRDPGAGVRLFPVPQLTAPHEVAARRVLPSFLYFGEPHELASGALALPWDPRPPAVAGALARDRGMLAPARQVASAKSWLAHPGVDRRARLLPWSADPAERRVSPVEASSRYLQHLRDAWNATQAADDERLRLERQAIVLTVPASFDEEARELTVEAAHAAGFERLTLVEEPLAAFYAWLSEHGEDAGAGLRGGELALVCDVGGGTTDFSLIRISVEAGRPSFERIAIGEHLLLGGDNLDLALAATLEQKLAAARPGARLTLLQRQALRRQAAAAKEQLLGDGRGDAARITVLGAGRTVVGGVQATELTRDEVLQALRDGFLPPADADARPAARDRHAGLKELGLPYEADPAITKHLAGFLARSAEHAEEAATGGLLVRPDLVLFNGGFFTPAAAREGVMAVLERWFGARPRELTTQDLAAAVATGAAYYGWLRARGDRSAMIRAGSPRNYYVVVRAEAGSEATSATAAHERHAVCVLARGTEEGTSLALEHEFTVVTNQPVAFTLLSSLARSDAFGSLVTLGPGTAVHEHAPLVTVLRYGRKSRHVEIPVRLGVGFTEVGTLELWCESRLSEHRWRLQFQLRGTYDETATEAGGWEAGAEPGGPGGEDEAGGAVVPGDRLEQAGALAWSVFGGPGAPGLLRPGGEEVTAENLVALIEGVFGFGKAAWPLAALRSLADVLLECADGRRRDAKHEARWLNLFGFCLRPGFGAAKDPWRVGQARGVYAGGLSFGSDIQCRVEWLVLWQRVAGGFNAAQQRDLAQRVLGDLGVGGSRKLARVNPQIERESWRLLASLERLDAGLRLRIGDSIAGRLRREAKNTSLLWALGRIGARTPIYGPLSSVVAPAAAEAWARVLLDLKVFTGDTAAAVLQVAGMTGDGLRDVGLEVRQQAASRLREAGFTEEATGFDRPRPLTPADTSRAFGEPLPAGLRLAREA